MERHSRRQSADRQHQDYRDGGSREAAMTWPEPVRVGLLGGFRVWVGPRHVGDDRWRLRKARSLVKLLALSPGPPPRAGHGVVVAGTRSAVHLQQPPSGPPRRPPR